MRKEVPNEGVEDAIRKCLKYTKSCIHCGVDIGPYMPDYCSHKCRRAAATARQREARAAERKFGKCRVCRKPLKRVGQKYCSDACRQKAWRERNA